MDKQTGMSVLLPHPVVTIGIIKEIDVLGIEPGEPDEGLAGGVDFLDQSDGLGGLGGLDGIWIFGERGFVDAFDDVIDPFEFLGLLSEFAPIAAGRPRIHLLNQLVRRDPHFLCNGSAKANPPTLAFLMEFALLRTQTALDLQQGRHGDYCLIMANQPFNLDWSHSSASL